MESAILGFGIQNSAQGIWNLTDDWNTGSQFHWQRVEPTACIASLRGSGVWKKMKGKVITGSNSLPLPFRTRVKQQASTVKPRLTATSFLRPLFRPPGKNRDTFSCKKELRYYGQIFGPLVTVLTGFHCTRSPKSTAWNPEFKAVLDSFPDFKCAISVYSAVA